VAQARGKGTAPAPRSSRGWQAGPIAEGSRPPSLRACRTPCWTKARRMKRRAGRAARNPTELPALQVERETGTGPATLSLGSSRDGTATRRSTELPAEETASGPSLDTHPTYQAASKRSVLADTRLTRAGGGSPGRSLEGRAHGPGGRGAAPHLDRDRARDVPARGARALQDVARDPRAGECAAQVPGFRRAGSSRVGIQVAPENVIHILHEVRLGS